MTNFGIIMFKTPPKNMNPDIQHSKSRLLVTFTNTNLQISPIFSCRAAGLWMDLTGNEHGGKLRSTTGFLITS